MDAAGRYQALVVGLVLLPAQLPAACLGYGQLFLAPPPPPHTCRDPPEPCPAECTAGWSYLGLGDHRTAVTQWDLVCHRAWLPFFGLAVFHIAGIAGYICYLRLAHSFGLRPCYFLLLSLQSAAGIASAFSPSFAWLVALRGLVGLTLPASGSLAVALSQSLVPEGQRGRVWLLGQLARAAGMVLVSGMVYLVPDWSDLCLATAVPFLTFYLYFWILPESPHFLLRTGRHDQLLRLLTVIHRTNNVPLTPTRVEAIKARLKHSSGETTSLCGPPCFQTVVHAVIWFSNSTVCTGLSYYALEMNQSQIHLSFTLSSAAELAGLAVLLLWRGSARATAFTCGALAGVTALFVLTRPRVSRLAIALLTAAKFLAAISWASQPPTPGLGELAGLSGIATLPSLLYLGRSRGYLPLVVLGALQLLGGLLVLVLPSSSSLEEKRHDDPADSEEALSTDHQVTAL